MMQLRPFDLLEPGLSDAKSDKNIHIYTYKERCAFHMLILRKGKKEDQTFSDWTVTIKKIILWKVVAR